MSEKDRVDRFLEFIGIRGYELKAYLTLLKLGEASAPKIASRSGIPLPRVYDVLDNLLKKGLVEVRAGRPRIYRALPPRIALTRYVERYMNKILSDAEEIVKILEKMYSSYESHEPYIWLSRSFETSVERMREWISEARIDGFASLDNRVLEGVFNTLSKKLGVESRSLFSLTLLEDPPGRILDGLRDIPNIMVLKQPTGFIRSLELDFEKAVIIGRNYTLFTTEHELITLINDTYYFAYFRNAEMVKKPLIEKGVIYHTRHQWMILPVLQDALRKGHRVKIRVTGRDTRSGKPVEYTGFVAGVEKTPEDTKRSIIVDTGAGLISVGGYAASVEDVEADFIEVEII